MVTSGVCKEGVKAQQPFPRNKDSVSINRFGGACLNKEGDTYVNYKADSVSPFKPKTWPERVDDKAHIGDFTKAKKKFFLQLRARGFNSNLEIPG